MTPDYDVIVIGAGIVGLATAHQLLGHNPTLRVLVVERDVAVALHQSSHNSGVLHAGVYYAPGSQKALLCARGKGMLEQFAEEHDIAVVRNGKVIVAIDDSEMDRFTALAARARANGVPGLREIDPDELHELEPHAIGVRALHSPTTAVVDFGAVCHSLSDELVAAGATVLTGAEVVALQEVERSVRVTTLRGEWEANVVVACAGLHADRVATLAGATIDVRIVPFRGSWLALRPLAAELVRGNIYPVPDPRFPFLGVHFTRRVDGSVWAGPNAVLAMAREGYRRGTINARDLAATLRYPGFWRLAGRHVVTGGKEMYRDVVRRAYVREMQRYVPAVTIDDVVPGPTGIRAQAVRRDGTMVDDFELVGGHRVVHVLNAPSPAATSSLAIGEVLAGEVLTRLGF